MRENRAMGLPIYARGLAILLSLGFILTSAQAKPPIRPPVLTKEAQRDLLKRAAAQKAAQKRIEARVAKEKEAAAKKAAEKKKELQKNGKPQKVMVQQQIQIQGNLVIRNGVPDKEEDSGGSTAILPQPDRETLQRLKDAKILIEKERFGEAVRILGDILSSSDDSFFPMEDDSEEGDRKIRGLRDEAEKILGGLPPQAMELYELQFGAQAKQFLKEAMQAGNTRAPADISRRFFYTEAGIEATWLAGLASMDEGRWKAAVLAFDRFKKVPHVASRYEPLLSILKSLCMEQAGQSKLAEKAWQGLRERSPRATIQIVGKSVPLFANQGETFQQFLKRANLDQLNVSSSLRALAANQMLPFGTPDRNASIDASLPLLKRTWRVRGTEQPMAEAILKKQRETCIDNGTLAVPRFYPLVVDGVLFARTLDVIVAIDIETGKRIWDAQADDPNEKRIAGSSSNASRVSSQLQSQLSQIWGNSIFGHLTSDTRNLYAIESDSMPKDAYQMRRMGVNSGGLSNILVAIDLENGEERWRRSTGIEDEPLFFLGPPLPLDGVLYSLAESRGEIQLVVLSASTGEVEWVQRIAISEQVAWPYSAQYYHAQMPAVLDGVMVCPTGTGAVVAIEPTTRSLLWAYCYERLGRRQHRMIMVNGMPRSANQDRIGEELVLHDNYVFSAPVDSNYLHCLDLRTGKEIWKQAFTDGAFIGGVYKDRLLVVGRNKFQTLNVKNGQKVGECFLDESLGDSGSVLVTGCGFRNEGIYYIAESSGDIVALDIERCKVVHRIHSREPMVLGNLVAADDRIFSQSLEGIEAFHQLKAIREKIEEQLKKDPNNLEAMGMQGDLLLAEGKVEEAVEKFRHIYKVAKTPANEERLLEAFCVALKDMYPKYRHMRPEIEVLLRTDQQKADYWYCVTIGETAENNLAAAADACIELANLSSQTRLTISTDRYHEVQRERFVQAQLGTIYAMADEDLQKKLADTILAKIESSIESEQLDLVKGAWNCFATLPPVTERQDQIVNELWNIDPVFAELALEQIIRFGDKREAATAMLHWAELLRKSDRLDEAAACYREALHRWETVFPTNSRKTVKTIIEALPEDDPVHGRMVVKDEWPEEFNTKTPSGMASGLNFVSSRGRKILLPVGLTSPIFRGKNLIYSNNEIILEDEYAREVWKVSLAKGGRTTNYYGSNANMRCSTVGHMIFLEFLDRVIAINTWDSKNPRIAWETNNPTINVSNSTARSTFARKGFSGISQLSYVRNQGNNFGAPGLYIGSQVLSLSGRELQALDAYDGTLLWNRRKIPQQIDFHTDGNLLSISSQAGRYYQHGRVTQKQAEKVTMRLVDGSRYDPNANASGKNAGQDNGKDSQKEAMARKAGQLAARLFMKSSGSRSQQMQKVLSLGRNMLVFSYSSKGYSFSLVDSLTKKPVWGPRTFHRQTRWTLLDQDYLGTIDRSGNFSLLRITDGKRLIQRKLKVDGSLQGIFLQDLGDRVGVIVSTRPRTNRRISRMSSLDVSEYVQQGRMYIFDWEGRSAMKKQPDGIVFQNQGILYSPPQRLPVITLVLQTFDHKKRSSPYKAEMKVFDARSGEEIMTKAISENLHSFAMRGDPERKVIEYQFNRRKYYVQFE